MVLSRREDCVQYVNGEVRCYDDDSFWYTDKGIIVKWVILASFFALFLGWFVGGYIHAKRRLKKGLPLLGYHRFLISYSERRRHGQVPQHHFTFYQQNNPYYPNQQQQPYQQRPGPYAEPPPLYNNADAPPQYFAPPGATKLHPNQGAAQNGGMEMPMYGAARQQGFGVPQGGQQSGVVGVGSGEGSGRVNGGDVEQGQTQTPQQLPERPQQAKAKLMGFVDRFRR